MKATAKIEINRTERWEWTASVIINRKHYYAVGPCEMSSERNLLRLLVFGNVKHLPLDERGNEILK